MSKESYTVTPKEFKLFISLLVERLGEIELRETR